MRQKWPSGGQNLCKNGMESRELPCVGSRWKKFKKCPFPVWFKPSKSADSIDTLDRQIGAKNVNHNKVWTCEPRFTRATLYHWATRVLQYKMRVLLYIKGCMKESYESQVSMLVLLRKKIQKEKVVFLKICSFILKNESWIWISTVFSLL